MTLMELYELVEADEELEGVGVDNTTVVIRCPGNGLKTKVAISSLEDMGWDTLRDILVGNREPQILRHMTRVVGYYANVSNFNPSKIGELKDRVMGDYAVDGSLSSPGSREARLKAVEALA